MKRTIGNTSLLFAILWSGCATAPAVNERTVATAAAIRAAEEVGAPKVPAAALHLQLAKEESERARGLIDSGDLDQANSLLMRAEVDANLAVILSRQSEERDDANQALTKAQQLKLSNQ